jgi:hypothetical protein
MESGQLTVQVATNPHEVRRLRSIWRQWTDSLETDVGYFSHNLKYDPTILRPHVVTVWKDGVAQAMLVGHLRKRKISTVISIFNIPGPEVVALEIVKGGRMGRQSPAIDKLLASEILRMVKSRAVDLVSFQRWSSTSGLLAEIQRRPGLLIKGGFPLVFHYSMLPLKTRAGERPSFLVGKPVREVRRKARILEREYAGKIRYKCFSSPDEMEASVGDALAVAAKTWQHHAGQGLEATPQTRADFRFFARMRWLRIYILYIEDTPCALVIGQLHRNTFYCQHVGYHPDFAHLSVGALLTAWAFENLAAAGVQQVDLGEGGQEHNRRLGCEKREEGTLYVYSPSWRGFKLTLFFDLTRIIRACGRGIRTGLWLERAARRWKQILVSRAKSPGAHSNRRPPG